MKTAISLPDELFKKAEQAAKRAHLSRSRLFAKALQQFLEGIQFRQITQSLNEVYSDESSRLDKALAHMQSLSLSQKEW